MAGDDLEGLDEDELDRFILNEEEVKIKERVWVELNKDYLEALAAKGDQTEAEAKAKSRKRRKTTNKPRDASTAAGGSAAESVRNLIKKNPKYSKRIKLRCAQGSLRRRPERAPSFSQMMRNMEHGPGLDVDGKEDGDGEGVVVIVEDEAPPPIRAAGKAVAQDMDVDVDDEDDEEDAEGDEVVGGWEDAYEQEI
ncbi:hypothetical protein D9611_014862 [Ephemerocybe angulata]|uniref:Brf1 TBP-binding domain-containing protein n=1 Tax=Ephemerocybe angulata TaxID=980116 RepID=A0A8H5B6T5_9AGAR|nr:hypothetical protein D9611_014862 [Tulosesus angulatus]